MSKKDKGEQIEKLMWHIAINKVIPVILSQKDPEGAVPDRLSDAKLFGSYHSTISLTSTTRVTYSMTRLLSDVN